MRTTYRADQVLKEESEHPIGEREEAEKEHRPACSHTLKVLHLLFDSRLTLFKDSVHQSGKTRETDTVSEAKKRVC